MTYRINHHTEETDCCECGMPLYVGDTVYTDESERDAFCSNDCMRTAAYARDEDATDAELTPLERRMAEREAAPVRKPQPQGVYVNNWLV